MKLINLQKSNRKNKRLMATFDIDGKIKHTHFGLKNPKVGTFLDHNDIKLRDAYRARHKKDLKTNDPSKAGYLSYYLLWGDSTNLDENVESFIKKFKLLKV